MHLTRVNVSTFVPARAEPNSSRESVWLRSDLLEPREARAWRSWAGSSQQSSVSLPANDGQRPYNFEQNHEQMVSNDNQENLIECLRDQVFGLYWYSPLLMRTQAACTRIMSRCKYPRYLDARILYLIYGRLPTQVLSSPFSRNQRFQMGSVQHTSEHWHLQFVITAAECTTLGLHTRAPKTSLMPYFHLVAEDWTGSLNFLQNNWISNLPHKTCMTHQLSSWCIERINKNRKHVPDALGPFAKNWKKSTICHSRYAEREQRSGLFRIRRSQQPRP